MGAAVVLTLVFVIAEAACGWFGQSLALLSDAGHNLTDAAALGFSWYALWIADKPSHEGMTFGYHRVGVFYQDKARQDFRLSEAQKRDDIQKGIQMEDKALSLNPEYMDAMTYKNILLRLQANMEKDMDKRKQLIDEADKLRNKVIDAQKRKQTGKGG